MILIDLHLPLSYCHAFFLPPPLSLIAWVVGDPHFITFDGTRYTFNGYGEFTLLQTDSGQFTIQGRMEPFPDNASGSILTALAVNYDGDRINIVTNEAGPNRGGLDVYLNDNHITPEYLPKMYFNKFMLGYNTSRILRVLFLNGVQLECQTSNGNITQFLVGVPSSLKGQVSGLFGTYNGDMADDLSPLTSSGSLGSPLQTTNIETVHSEFGLSCKQEVSIMKSQSCDISLLALDRKGRS